MKDLEEDEATQRRWATEAEILMENSRLKSALKKWLEFGELIAKTDRQNYSVRELVRLIADSYEITRAALNPPEQAG